MPHLRDARPSWSSWPSALSVCPRLWRRRPYFVAGEALANVVKHAGASRVAIHTTRTNGRLVIDITDDGNGGADADGAGLSGLRDRVEALDGYLTVESPSGGGTRAYRGDPVRVILADDAVLIREGLARLLAEQGVDVIGQVGGADELMRLVRSDAPDVAVVDIRMPPTFTNEGLLAAQRIRRRHPQVATVVLSQYVELEYALTLVTGTSERVGYLLKDRIADVGEFVAALQRVAAGGTVVDASLVHELLRAPTARDPLAELTPREREVLALIAQGKTDRGIGDELYVTRKTVEAHVRSILAKLELPADASENRRVHAVLTFLRAGGSHDPGGVRSGVLIDAPETHRP